MELLQGVICVGVTLSAVCVRAILEAVCVAAALKVGFLEFLSGGAQILELPQKSLVSELLSEPEPTAAG